MKKDEERECLKRFTGLRPDLRIADVRDSERPDFLCVADGVPIGVEVTRFYFPSTAGVPLQAVAEYRNRLAGFLREEHVRRGIPPVHVSVHFFSVQKLISNAARDLLALALLDFVSQRIPPVGPLVTFNDEDLPGYLTDFGVDRISVLRNSGLTEPFWSMPHAGFLPESRSPLIQTILDEKAANISEYRKKARTIWLLVVAGGGLHSMIDVEGDVLSASYVTSFDRLFLLRTIGSSAHELKRTDPLGESARLR